MNLKYALFKNRLVEDENNHMAVPQNVAIYHMADLIKEMAVPGGVTRTQAAAVLESFIGVQEKLLEQGCAIQTDLYLIHPHISGSFNGPNDSFDPARHKIRFSANLGSRMKAVAAAIQTEKVKGQSRKPQPENFIDTFNGVDNKSATPGKVGDISGELLKFDASDAQQGVFFISGAQEYRAAKYLHNTAGLLSFYIPEELIAGTYRVEIRAILTGTKSIRIGTLDAVLTVA